MKLEQLRPNLLEIPINQAYELFLAYYTKRSQEIKEVLATPRETKSQEKKRLASPGKKKKTEITVSQKDLAILKQLGLI